MIVRQEFGSKRKKIVDESFTAASTSSMETDIDYVLVIDYRCLISYKKTYQIWIIDDMKHHQLTCQTSIISDIQSKDNIPDVN